MQTLLVGPDASRPGYRCQVCGRLQVQPELCKECGGHAGPVANIYEEAIQDAIEQAAEVNYWDDPQLQNVESLAALGRF